MKLHIFQALVACLILSQGAWALDVTHCSNSNVGHGPEQMITRALPAPLSDTLAPILSNATKLSHQKFKSHEVGFKLADGTQVGGLYFPSSDPANSPLIIASFGLFASRWGGPSAMFFKQLVESGKVHANVILLDSTSSAPYYAGNAKQLSFGGYDDGQMLIQIASQLKKGDVSDIAPFSSISLLGASLSGPGVLYAMAEDSKKDLGLFQSALTLNSVVNLQSSTATYMNYGGHPLPQFSGPKITPVAILDTWFEWKLFNANLKKISGAGTDVDVRQSGDLFYKAFSNHLSSIRQAAADGKTQWDPSIKTTSVEDYLSSQNVQAQLSEIKKPVTMVHTKDDPVVPYSEFLKVVQGQEANPSIQTITEKKGGHLGYFAAQGTDWIAGLVNDSLKKSADKPLSSNCASEMERGKEAPAQSRAGVTNIKPSENNEVSQPQPAATQKSDVAQ